MENKSYEERLLMKMLMAYGVKQQHVTRKTKDATATHFNLPGHTPSDMILSAVEIVNSNDPINRKAKRKVQYLKVKYILTRNEWEPRSGFHLITMTKCFHLV